MMRKDLTKRVLFIIFAQFRDRDSENDSYKNISPHFLMEASMTSKNLIFGSIFGLILIFGGTFVLLENNKPTQNNPEYPIQTNNTGTNLLPVLSSEIQNAESSQPGDTTTQVQSNLNQSQSGLVFHAPNTEWKARTITLNDGRVVTYRFGEGNPEEVMPKLSDYTIPEQDYLHDTIVRPKTEKLLKEFLSNPMLAILINKCGPFTKADTSSVIYSMHSLPDSLYTADFSLENMLKVDLENQRKELNFPMIQFIQEVFGQIRNGIYKNQSSIPIANTCLSPNELPGLEQLWQQFISIQNSAANDSLENLEESQTFLR
jgi:hypothetical protein